MARLLYSLLIYLATPLIPLRLLWRARKQPEYLQHLGERWGFYRGKVRDVYHFGDTMAMVATDRISAFDVILPRAIPDKGRVLNQIAARNLEATKNLVPNWVIKTPDPNVTIGFKCEPFPVEMVVRGYLAGHAAREYKAGKRML